MQKIFIGLALTATLLSSSAHAQFAKMEDAVKYRQSVMSVMGTHTGRVGAVVKGEKPYDKVALEKDAAIIEMMSRLSWHAFPAGSELPNSKARSEIWKDQDKFKAAAAKLEAEAAKLSAAARTGDLVSIKTAFGGLGQSCKSCHDSFSKK